MFCPHVPPSALVVSWPKTSEGADLRIPGADMKLSYCSSWVEKKKGCEANIMGSGNIKIVKCIYIYIYIYVYIYIITMIIMIIMMIIQYIYIHMYAASNPIAKVPDEHWVVSGTPFHG